MKRKLLLQLAVLLVSLGGACAGDFEEHFQGKYWVREYYNEAISKNSRYALLDYFQEYKEDPYYYEYAYDTDVFWFEEYYPAYVEHLQYDKEKYSLKIYTKLYATFKVSNIEEIDTDFYKVEISDIRDDEFDIERAIKFGYDFSFCKGRKEYTFYFRFDYEYLYVLLEDKEHIFATYCLYDKDEYEALLEAIKTDNFEQYAFSFPRHADGTCDYDGIAEKPDIIAPGVIMTVKENQKLHSEDHATSEVRATLPAGTRVRFYKRCGDDVKNSETVVLCTV